MKFSIVAVAFIGGIATALPQPQGINGKGAISELQARVASNNPGGDVGSAVLVERQAADNNNNGRGNRPVNKNQRAAKSKSTGNNGGSNLIQQLQETFDRNNPNGTPAAPGDPDDLNGDGVINVFEAGAQAS